MTRWPLHPKVEEVLEEKEDLLERKFVKVDVWHDQERHHTIHFELQLPWATMRTIRKHVEPMETRLDGVLVDVKDVERGRVWVVKAAAEGVLGDGEEVIAR